MPFKGFIDRIERTPDGEYEVVDFKTGGVYENSRSIKEDPQMNAYALGVQKLYGKLPKKASLFYVREDEIVPYAVTEQQVSKVKAAMAGVVSAILEEKFDATPSFKACRNCPYWDICDSKETEE